MVMKRKDCDAEQRYWITHLEHPLGRIKMQDALGHGNLRLSSQCAFFLRQ